MFDPRRSPAMAEVMSAEVGFLLTVLTSQMEWLLPRTLSRVGVGLTLEHSRYLLPSQVTKAQL